MRRAARWFAAVGIAAVSLVGAAGAAGAQVYPPIGDCGLRLGVSTAEPGQTFTITGTQGEPNVTVDLFFESGPVFLGSVTTDANGRFATQAAVPAGAADGRHRVTATGVVSCSASLTIASGDGRGDDGTPPRQTSSTRTVGPGLAFTGANTMGLVLFALVVMTIGIALFGAERRNSSVREARRAQRRAARTPANR